MKVFPLGQSLGGEIGFHHSRNTFFSLSVLHPDFVSCLLTCVSSVDTSAGLVAMFREKTLAGSVFFYPLLILLYCAYCDIMTDLVL